MSDIIERLRANAKSEDCLADMEPELLYAAADEISRLRADFDALNELLRATCEELDALKEQGSVAWADIPKATEWLEDLRGNAPTPKPGEGL